MRGRLPLLLALLALPLLPAASASQVVVREDHYDSPIVLGEPYDCAPSLLGVQESLAWVGPDGLLVRRNGATLLLNDTGFLHLTSSSVPSALSPDGRWLALAFRIAENDPLNRPIRLLSEIRAACGDHQGFVVDLWDRSRTPLPGPVRALVGGPGGLVVITDAAALVYAWGAWSEYAKVPLPESGPRLFYTAEPSEYRGNSTSEHEDIVKPRLFGAPLRSVALSDDGRTLAVVTENSALHLLDVATGAPVHPDFPAVHFGESQIAHVAFAPGGAHVAAATRYPSAPDLGTEIHVIAVRGPAFGIVATSFEEGSPSGLAWSPAGLAVALGPPYPLQGFGAVLRLLSDPVNLTGVVEVRWEHDVVNAPLAWSTDGERLAVLGNSGSWDAPPGVVQTSWSTEDRRLYLGALWIRLLDANLTIVETVDFPTDLGPALYPPPVRMVEPPCCEGREGMMPMDTVEERYVPGAFGVLAIAALAAPALLRRKN